ncbi:hypothetical protein CASFOL_012033 [Castilleja foliolosa]|uniref:Zinc finger GRF-type domain-containing protein n=1 Tax=Castilleja foliolosa TaxID=1961234 RepID=A0ABD3DQX0_9LAMI
MSRQSTRSNQFPAQNGSGSRSSSSYGNAAVRCHCGIQLELVTSWTDDNPGRRFQACPNYKLCHHAVGFLDGLTKKCVQDQRR